MARKNNDVDNKAIKYRAYPTEAQRVLHAKTVGCCRKVWNLMLADEIANYKATGTYSFPTPASYKSTYPYLKEPDSSALSNVQLNLDKAFKSFFNRTANFPKFKSKKHSSMSYTTNVTNGNIAVSDRYVKLPKMGLVRIKRHRDPYEGWRIKSATMSKEPDGKYYISVLFERPSVDIPKKRDVNKATALDYSSDGLYVDDKGNRAEMPKYYKASQKKLARAQRSLSRKQGPKSGSVPSKNYLKQKERVARIHAKIRRQRADIQHKLSNSISKSYDIVCIEDLGVKELSSKKNKYRLGKSFSDNAWGQFTRMLEYKLKREGGILVKVDRYFASSQICSKCGHKNPATKNLKLREWTCPECGEHHDRDINAAINIRQEGLRILADMQD